MKFLEQLIYILQRVIGSALTPPPHSTGAAIDLTLADMNGNPLDLGGEIDFIGHKSRPDFYEENSLRMPYSKYQVFHSRRSLLFSVMKQAGFVQHPNEWWHFSFGDQLWSWFSKQCDASDATKRSLNFDYGQNSTHTIRMCINAAGNLGIGTANPGYKLNISTDTNYDGISLRDILHLICLLGNQTLFHYLRLLGLRVL